MSKEQGPSAKKKNPLGLILAVVLVVLGVFVAPSYKRARLDRDFQFCKENLKDIGAALDKYGKDSSGKFPSSLEALTPNYLKTLPECPAAGRTTYSIQVGPNAPSNKEKSEEYYYVECQGGNHTGVSVTGNFPAYNFTDGLIERSP